MPELSYNFDIRDLHASFQLTNNLTQDEFTAAQARGEIASSLTFEYVSGLSGDDQVLNQADLTVLEHRQRAFNAALELKDADGNGQFNAAELAAAGHSNWMKADANGDGQVSLDEMLASNVSLTTRRTTYTNYDTAVQTATEQGRSVVILFGRDGCSNCSATRAALLNGSEAINQELNDNYLYCYIDIDDPANQAFLLQHFGEGFTDAGYALPIQELFNPATGQRQMASGIAQFDPVWLQRLRAFDSR